MINLFESDNIYLMWKPHGLASAFGIEKSFLDYVFIDNSDLPQNLISYENIDKSILKYINNEINKLNLKIIKSSKDKQKLIQDLIMIFGKDKEFGLLNRLDNDTGGLLYFAKTDDFYNGFKLMQSKKIFSKFYISQVNGNPFFKTKQSEIIIDYPIMHHKFSKDRMITIKNELDTLNGTGKIHKNQTTISLLNYDKQTNISTLLISINKGIRHQIRVHLASIGCSIIGDCLYGNKKDKAFLHLWSVGIK